MDADFWHKRWADNEIGFHQPQANSLLVAHFGALQLSPPARVFVPLCGKTRDIGWLAAQGYRVAGVELSARAVEQLFAELEVVPEVSTLGALQRYRFADIDIFVGDIFALDAASLGAVDAVYDRAALVALPGEMRARYTRHLAAITGAVPQLLICFEYDQTLMNGPPFSIAQAEVELHYASQFSITQLVVQDVPGGLKGQCAACEHAWLLRRK